MSRPIAGTERAGHRRQPRARPRAGAGAGARRRARRAGGAPRRASWRAVVAAIRAARRRGARHRRRRRRPGRGPRHRRPGGGAGRPDRRAGQQRQHAGAGAAAAAARHRLRGSRARAGGEPGRPVPADEGAGRADGAARAAGRSSTSPPTPRPRRTSAGAPTARRRRRWISSGASGRRSWRAPACACSPSTRARWTRACTPTRSPTPTAPTLADPARVAARIVALLQAEPGPARGRARRDPHAAAARRAEAVAHEARDDIPAATRRRAPAGDRSRGARGRGAARDAHPCPARLPRAPAICWSSTTRRPCRRRCAGATTPATRSRRA